MKKKLFALLLAAAMCLALAAVLGGRSPDVSLADDGALLTVGFAYSKLQNC